LDAVDLEQLAELIEAFDGVLESDDPELERLPEGVPEPGHYEGEPQRRAPGELSAPAVGYLKAANNDRASSLRSAGDDRYFSYSLSVARRARKEDLSLSGRFAYRAFGRRNIAFAVPIPPAAAERLIKRSGVGKTVCLSLYPCLDSLLIGDLCIQDI
jgi:hypothetical protein